MRKHFLIGSMLFVFALLFSCTIVITPTLPKTWQAEFGGTGDEQVISILQVNGGGYIGTGYTTSETIGLRDIYVFKLSEDGVLVWENMYGGTGNDEGLCIQKTNDGGYIVAGYTTSSSNDEDVYVVKLDQDGESEWGKTYTNPGNDRANCIQETADGNYVITGFTTVTVTSNSLNSSNVDVLFLKIDEDGDILSQKRFGGTGEDKGKWIQQTNDGGYIIAGSTNSFGAGGNDVYIVKLNSDGDYEWDKTYGGTGNDEANGVVQTDDGNYVFAGSWGIASLESKLYVAKISGADPHNILWSKNYGGNYLNSAYSIQKTNDGGYILAGVKNFKVTSVMPFTATSDAYILKLNSTGNEVWERTYSKGELSAAYSIQKTNDGGYIVGGTTKESSDELGNAYVLKLDQLGQIN
ncbi:MAG: hypothetical protein ABFC76_03245 [Fervidobacterium sp.]